MTPTVAASSDAPAGSWRELLTIALPLMASQGSLSIMYVADRLMLTWYSPEAMEASMPATAVHWMFMSLVIGTAGYVNTFVAQYEGAQRPHRVSAAVWQGVWLTFFAGGFLLALAQLAGPLFEAVGHAPEVRGLEQEMFRILCLGSMPLALATTLGAFYSGRGKTGVVLAANALMCLASIALDYVLIFGFRPIPEAGMAGTPGFPVAGVRAAAVANVLAACFCAAFYLGVLYSGGDGRKYAFFSQWKFDGELFRRLLRYGLPAGLHLFLEVVCITAFLLLVGRFGKMELLATNVAFNLNSLAFVPIVGLATAVSTVVGKRVGEGRPREAVASVWKALLLATGFSGIFVFLYLAAPQLILRPYAMFGDAAGFAEVEPYVTNLLRFVALYAVFDGIQLILSFAVRGAGDTRFPVVFSSSVGLALLVVPTVLIYQYGYSGGLLSGPAALGWSWTALAAYIIALAVGMGWRFWDGRWQKMRVIEHAER